MILLCGRSFSGKSTVARELAERLNGTIVSLDAINEERGLHGGQGIPIAEWARTNEIAQERVIAALAEDQTVVIDDTSSPRFLRDRWREITARAGAVLALVFIDADAATIMQRQAANRAAQARDDVTDDVMAEHLETFEPPEPDEKALRFTSEELDMNVVTSAVKGALSGRR